MTVLDPPAPAAPIRPSVSGWPDVTDVTPPDRPVAVAVVVAAVATDLALRSGVIGLAGALLCAVLAGGLLLSGRVPNRRAWPIVALVPLFGMWLAARASPWLLPLDVLAAAGLLVLGASLSRAGDPSDLTIPALGGRAVHGLVHGVLAPGFLLAGRRRRGDYGRSGAVLRGLILGAPVLCVLALLLGSADPVFASFFRFPTDVGDAVLHAVLLTIGAWGAAGLLRMASAAPYAVPPGTRRPLGALEATTVVAGLVVLFAAFAVSQVVAVVRGAAYVARTAGLSYASYARTGFFQLLAAAAIAVAVLLALRAMADLGAAAARRRFLVLGEVCVLLTLLLVAGALRRLWLYEQAYGLTMLRLCSFLFALWIGAVLILLGVSLAGVGRRRAWLVPAAGALALAGLLVTNAANPEALVVRRNVERFAGTDKLDAGYLTTLSDDAVPELLRQLPRLDPDGAAVVSERVCAGRRHAGGGWAAFNGSVDAAVEARLAACP